MSYAKWKVRVEFENGFVHTSEWNADEEKAREMVVGEAKIEHERKYGEGDRGVVTNVSTEPV